MTSKLNNHNPKFKFMFTVSFFSRRYDFPLFKSELLAAGVDEIVGATPDKDGDSDHIFCADSLVGLRKIYSEEQKVIDEEIDAVEKLMNQVSKPLYNHRKYTILFLSYVGIPLV